MGDFRWVDPTGTVRVLLLEDLRARVRAGIVLGSVTVTRLDDGATMSAAEAAGLPDVQDLDVPPPPPFIETVQRSFEGTLSGLPPEPVAAAPAPAPRRVPPAGGRTVIGMSPVAPAVPGAWKPHLPDTSGAATAGARTVPGGVFTPRLPQAPVKVVDQLAVTFVGDEPATTPMHVPPSHAVATQPSPVHAPPVQVLATQASPVHVPEARPSPAGPPKAGGTMPKRTMIGMAPVAPRAVETPPVAPGKGQTAGIDDVATDWMAPPAAPAAPPAPVRPSVGPHGTAIMMDPVVLPMAPVAPMAPVVVEPPSVRAGPHGTAILEPYVPPQAPVPEPHEPGPMSVQAPALPPIPGPTATGFRPTPQEPSSSPSFPGQDDEAAPSLAGVPKRRAMVPVLVGLGALVTLITIGAIIRVATRPKDEPAAAGTTSSAKAPAASAPAPTASEPPSSGRAACKAAKAPARLAARASKDIPVELGAIPSTSSIAVGFSPNGATPLGLDVNTETLAVKSLRVKRTPGKLRMVTPTATARGAEFVVDADAPKAALTLAQTVPVEPPYVIGVADGALMISDKASEVGKKLWPVEGTIDAIRVLLVPGEGVAVAVRAGGAIYVGEVAVDRSPRGALARVSATGQVGTPTLGTNGVELALAFAFRSGQEAWSVRLAHGPKGAPLPAAVAFATPPGGPGGDAFAPAIAGMSDGRWVLAWTEGTAGGRGVRAVTLDTSGAPFGEAFPLSAPGANAGQASLAIGGGTGLAVYLTAGKKATYDLWGATFTCL